MTIRLLSKYGKYQRNTVVTLNPNDEARLLLDGSATTDLTSGTVPSTATRSRYSTPVSSSIIGGVEYISVNGHDVSVASLGNLIERTSALRVVTFGDSTANWLTVNGSTSNTDTQLVSIAFPGSGASTIVVEPARRALSVVYPHAYFVGNGGISGQTSTQMLARDTAGASATRSATADVLNLRPDVILFSGGSINDFQTVISSTVDSTVTATFANHASLLGRLMSSGAFVLDFGIYGFGGTPYTGSATDLASTQVAVAKFNALCVANAAANTTGRLVFVNPTGLVSDTKGAYLPGMSLDGTHLSPWGGYTHAQTVAALLTERFGASVGPRYRGATGANVVPNASLAATGSATEGITATGFTTTIGGGGVRSNAKVELIDGVAWQTCEYRPTVANMVGGFTMPYDPSSAGPMGITANDVWGFELDFAIWPLPGSTFVPNLTAMQMRIDTTMTSNGRIVIDTLSPASYVPLLGPIKGRQVFVPWQIPQASAALSAVSSWKFNVTTDDAANGFKLGISGVRICKLGTPVNY